MVRSGRLINLRPGEIVALMRQPLGGRLSALLAVTVIVTCTAATPPPDQQSSSNSSNSSFSSSSTSSSSSRSSTGSKSRTRAFVLTVKADSETPRQRTVLLACSPPRGSHPQAAEACAKLATVKGDLARLEPAAIACPMNFDPVTVTAIGSWDHWTLSYERTFGNSCELRALTGPVFDF
jgi:hypothetical protein